METPENLSENAKKNIQEVISDEQFIENVQNDILTNERYEKFFAPYDKDSRKNFADRYSHIKQSYTKYARMYQSEKDHDLLEYLPEAQEKLWEIQQKKLFDLQCRWRAGLIELPGVECTFDFIALEKDIKNVSFIPPITQDEVNLYIRYLQSDNTNEKDYITGWQDYDEFKEDDSSLPDWYAFYNLHTGAGSLLLLPDIKGDKESFYRKIESEHEIQIKKNNGTYQEPEPYIAKPYLNVYNSSTIQKFVDAYEDNKNKLLYSNYRNSDDKNDGLLERAQDTICLILSNIKELVPIEANSDWRKAILLAVNKYENKKIIKALNTAYSEYKVRIEMKLGYSKSENQYLWFDNIKQQILKGRELNGEERNFNY